MLVLQKCVNRIIDLNVEHFVSGYLRLPFQTTLNSDVCLGIAFTDMLPVEEKMAS